MSRVTPETAGSTVPESFTARAWEYATETGQDVRDVYIRLLTLISMTSPEAIDAAFAEMQATVPGERMR